MQKVICLFVCLFERRNINLYLIDHYNAVAEAILSAKVEIYIADWWLTPELVCLNVIIIIEMNLY